VASAAAEAEVSVAVLDRPKLRLLGFKPLRKNSLRGFATIELPIGLRIADIPIVTSHGKVWAALPGKPVLGADGEHVEVDGERQYASIVEWRDRALSDGFSRAVVDAVRSAHPAAIGEDAP
jgi:hypothetical protein